MLIDQKSDAAVNEHDGLLKLGT